MQIVCQTQRDLHIYEIQRTNCFASLYQEANVKSFLIFQPTRTHGEPK